MKHLLVTLSVLFSLNTAFAETYVCNFRHGLDAMRVKFAFDPAMENAQVTVYRKNRIQLSHQTRGSSAGEGDGWDIFLFDRNHPQYRYRLFFNAMDIYSLVVTIPGSPEMEVETCRRQR